MLHHIFLNQTGSKKSKHITIEINACDDIEVLNIDEVYYTMINSVVFIHCYHRSPIKVTKTLSPYNDLMGTYTCITIEGKRHNDK